jgi:hypothetical protein
VTVREWIARRTPPPPSSLSTQILALLGDDAGANESETAEVCLGAAARALDGLLARNRFARDSALELLAVDALTTYAYEHASLSRDGARRVEVLAAHGTELLGRLTTQRV